MKHIIVSSLVAILSIFRLPVKAASRTITRITDSTLTLKNQIDRVAFHVDNFAQQFVEYAKNFIGVKYRWGGATNPKVGLDCSGFVNYVSQHFDISVPRTAAQFTNLGLEVNIDSAQAGDLILFKGSNPKSKKVGHMGIVVGNNEEGVEFIHSSSGHKMGVHISELAGYYKQRLVKIIRIFPLNENSVIGYQKAV
jgi:cell wall-associated NlpC family hydrolase